MWAKVLLLPKTCSILPSLAVKHPLNLNEWLLRPSDLFLPTPLVHEFLRRSVMGNDVAVIAARESLERTWLINKNGDIRKY